MHARKQLAAGTITVGSCYPACHSVLVAAAITVAELFTRPLRVQNRNSALVYGKPVAAILHLVISRISALPTSIAGCCVDSLYNYITQLYVMLGDKFDA